MASRDLRSDYSDDNKELESQILHKEILDIIQNLSRENTNFSDLGYDKTFFEIHKKLNQMIVALQKISSILETKYADEKNYWGKIMDYAASSNHELAKQILKEVQECTKIAESCISMICRIQDYLRKVYIILIQLRLEGIRMPQIDDCVSPVEMSISNIIKHSIEENNTTSTTHVYLVQTLIHVLANQSAKTKKYQTFLDSTDPAFTKFSLLVRTAYRFFEYPKGTYDKISDFERQFTECGVRKNLEMLSNYIEEAMTSSQSDEIVAIKQCLGQVWNSVESSEQQSPNKSRIDIIKEMSEMSFCSGLVRPITTKIGCTIQEAWGFVIRLSSSGVRT